MVRRGKVRELQIKKIQKSFVWILIVLLWQVYDFFIKIVKKLVEQLLRKTKIVCMSIGNHSKWEEGLVLNEFLIHEKKISSAIFIILF